MDAACGEAGGTIGLLSAQLSHGLPVFGMRTVAPFAAVLCPLVKWPKSGGSQQGQPSHWVDARFRYVGTEL